MSCNCVVMTVQTPELQMKMPVGAEFCSILGYGDMIPREVTIKWVYYVEGLNHNLLLGWENDLLTGKRGSDLNTISLQEQLQPTQSVSWLKLHHLKHVYVIEGFSHLNSYYNTLLSKKDVVNGLPKNENMSDQTLFVLLNEKAKRNFIQDKSSFLFQREGLNLLHMDIHLDSFTTSKDEKHQRFSKTFLKMNSTQFQAQVILSVTDRGTEFLNKTLHAYYPMKKALNIKLTPRTPCGYSTQSKGYRVYNKRTRLIAESIHIKFDEIKEMMSDHNSSDLAPQRPRGCLVKMSSSGPPEKEQISSQQGLEFLFSPLLEEYYNPAHGHVEENNNDQAPNASFQEAEFINPFCTRLKDYAQERVLILKNHFALVAFALKLSYLRAHRTHKSFSNLLDNHPEKVYLLRNLLLCIKRKLQEPGNYELIKLPDVQSLLKIYQSPKGIVINQAKYGLEILKKHNMDNCHSIGTPLATKPKLDVDLSGEPVDNLIIDSGFELTTFSDADHAGCLDTRKSTSGGIQFLGDKLVSWMSKETKLALQCLQQRQSTWRYLQVVLNQAIAILMQPHTTYRERKHIHTADMFTKALPEDQFKYLVRRIGMRCLTPADLEVLTNETA
ncbi:integrase, catalytic region, zinc finger, CCHC-type containing protein [Tanacetum coccineum]